MIVLFFLSEPTDWDQKVGLLSIRHGSIDAEIEGWEGGAFMIRCESVERARIAPFVADLCTRVDPEEPVDMEKYGITDYYDVVLNPMDFGTIKIKLNTF